MTIDRSRRPRHFVLWMCLAKTPKKIEKTKSFEKFSREARFEYLSLFIADWDDIIPVTPCHWDDIIPVDGGWLPHWDEALDESTGIIEAVYFAF